MKNGIEIRPNGNKITKRENFGYDVHILRSDGGFKKSDSNPWDYLGNARRDADSKTPLHLHVKCTKSDVPLMENLADKIREYKKLENVINYELHNTYIPLMEKCEAIEELLTLIYDIKRTLGFKCGESFPWKFEVDVVMQFHRIIEKEKKSD